MDQPIIRVEDEGHARRVHVLAPQRGHFRFTNVESAWPADLLESLARLKGAWFCDSYARFEHPNYLRKQIDQILAFYGIALTGLRILDFGCGFGASSYGLAKGGATDIVATDLMAENAVFARDLFARLDLGGRIDVRQENVVPTLEPGSFDVVWLQAVVEHLRARQLPGYFARLYQDARVKTTLRGTVVAALGLLEPAARLILRRPAMAFTPYLNHVAFRKAW